MHCLERFMYITQDQRDPILVRCMTSCPAIVCTRQHKQAMRQASRTRQPSTCSTSPRQGMRTEVQMARQAALMQRQAAVLRRKLQEAAASRKRLVRLPSRTKRVGSLAASALLSDDRGIRDLLMLRRASQCPFASPDSRECTM